MAQSEQHGRENNIKFYSIAIGKKVGIYESWGQCHNQVNKVSGALYKGFETLDESVQFMLDNTSIQRNNMVVYDSRGRGKPLEDYIETVSDDENESNHGAAEETVPKVVVNTSKNHTDTVIIDPVLSYVIYALDNSPAGYVTNCCIQFYTIEELTRAKDIIWDVADSDVVGPYIKRRDGPKRSAVDNVAADITSAIQKLDQAGIVPRVAVDSSGLHRIPKVIPAETNALSMCERMAVMESRIQQLEESMSVNVCKTITMGEKMDKITSYANAVTDRAGPAASKPAHVKVSPPLRPNISVQRVVTETSTKQLPRSDSRAPENVHSSLRSGTSQSADILRSRTNLMRSSSQQSLASATSQQSGTFQLQRAVRKKLRRRVAPIVGTGTSDKVRGAPEPSRDVFVYRVQSDITVGDISSYVADTNVEVRNVIQKSQEGSKFMSFQVTVKVTDLNTLLQPDFWPCGVCVRRFRLARHDSHNGFS
jgi:hypothetical protein